MLVSFDSSVEAAISRNNHENKIEYHSHHDYLTGLYKRRFYDEALIRLDKKENLPLTLIMADVNGLKIINDSFGHTMAVSYTHLRAHETRHDLVCRLLLEKKKK